MSFVETIVGVAAGSVLGFVGSILTQNLFFRRQKIEEVKERVYSPLYDEIAEAAEEIEDGLPSQL